MNTILLCRILQVPTPEQVAEALRQAGYPAAVDSESGSLISTLVAELSYAPDKMPITVKFYAEQRETSYDAGYEEWRWRQDIVPSTMDQKDIRRFIFVEAQQDIDITALQVVIDYIANQTDAVIAAQ